MRLGGTTSGYERIRVPDDDRRGLGRRLPQQLVPHRRRAGAARRTRTGCWPDRGRTPTRPPRCRGRGSTSTPSWPAWFDRWLRGRRATHEDRCDVFVRSSTRPEIDLDLHEGWWLTLPSVPPVTEATLDLTAPVSLRVVPDVGTAAWIDCAGHLPVGPVRRPAARRRALADLGDRARRRPRSSAIRCCGPGSGPTEPPASLSVKLCDVFPDGTSALVSRGSLDLAYRDGVHGSPSPLVPGHESTRSRSSSTRAPTSGRPATRLRVSVAGADWPNTDRPAGAGDITLRTASLTLPLLDEARSPPRRSARAPSTPRSRPRASAGRSTTTCSPA